MVVFSISASVSEQRHRGRTCDCFSVTVRQTDPTRFSIIGLWRWFEHNSSDILKKHLCDACIYLKKKKKYNELKDDCWTASQAPVDACYCVFLSIRELSCTVFDKLLDVSGLCFFVSDNSEERLCCRCRADMDQNVIRSTSRLLICLDQTEADCTFLWFWAPEAQTRVKTILE